jgi:hypothetical protein
MELIPNIITFLMQNPTVTALFDHRITGIDVPDGQTYPYAYLWEPNSNRIYTHQGAGGREVLVQLDVVSDTIISCDEAKRTLEDALTGYRGMMGEVSVGKCFVNTTSVPKDADQKAYRNILEITIGLNS